MRNLLTKKNAAIAATVVSVVVSAALVRRNYAKLNKIRVEIPIGDLEDISKEEIVETTPVNRTKKD